jgi:hypothetical protein
MIENKQFTPPKTPNKKLNKILTGVAYIFTIISILIEFTIIPATNIIINPSNPPLPLIMITITVSLFTSYYIMITDEDLEINGIILLLINFIQFFMILLNFHINIVV